MSIFFLYYKLNVKRGHFDNQYWSLIRTFLSYWSTLILSVYALRFLYPRNFEVREL